MVLITLNNLQNIEDQDAEKYLNIYSGYPGSSLESIMKNCKTLKLNFSPFQLNHAIHLCGTQRNVSNFYD